MAVLGRPRFASVSFPALICRFRQEFGLAETQKNTEELLRVIFVGPKTNPFDVTHVSRVVYLIHL